MKNSRKEIFKNNAVAKMKGSPLYNLGDKKNDSLGKVAFTGAGGRPIYEPNKHDFNAMERQSARENQAKEQKETKKQATFQAIKNIAKNVLKR